MANHEWRDDPELITALDQSIEHWERLASGTKKPLESIFCRDCSLCQVVMSRHREGLESRCTGCPIMLRTGRDKCNGTPWREVWEYWTLVGYEHTGFRVAALKMLTFLKELRDSK